MLIKMSAARKHTSLNIKQKLNVISDYKKYDKEELCTKYKCSRATINRILKNKTSLIEKSKTVNGSTKRDRSGACAKVEKALLFWFNQIRESGAVISRNMLLEKSKQFAVEMNEDFSPTHGWLHRWQKRVGITLKKIHGEGASADNDAANAFCESVLPDLISKYQPSEIFNADESGIFYKALPKSTLTKKGDQKRGFKNSKELLTLLFICNATGDYKKAIVIGKSKNPRCFRNKSLPLKYYSQNKAWMTQSLWQEILCSLDDEMGKQGRKIILFVDNAACHKTSAVFQNIDLQFLPANTTSIIQPLDQGIIHCFKCYYRQNLLRKQISAVENGKTIADFMKSFSIFNAMHVIQNSWWLVKPTTINNCFKKSKIFPSTEPTELEHEVCLDVEQESADFENYVRCDDNIPCYGQLTDQEIINEICQELTSDNSSDEENEDVVNNPPSSKEVLCSINILRDFFFAKESLFTRTG
ncbi:tigger transposable element-derived protein 6-like [Lucilia sericata]|uniref:tigger transposable element-derived protein 6-like n=1 Tax=Lucilia sericata TaxID=13632 RepID=UPI0018A8419A|nr:tigger transposable element-derived protein 6-like [Lucilia sericata]